MQQIGFSLVKDGAELARFASIPEPYRLPGGDAVHGLTAGMAFEAGTFLPCWMIDNPVQWCSRVGETAEVQEDKVVVTVDYAATPDQRPETISDRQFFQQLAIQGEVTEEEAIAAVATGALPQRLIDVVSGLPAEQQFAANMLLKGARSFNRSHPMVAMLGEEFGWTEAQIDDLWRAAFEL